MKEVADSVGGWMWYITNVKSRIARPLSEEECRKVMKCYISSKSFDQAVGEIQNDAN